jgi:hypothetical protein
LLRSSLFSVRDSLLQGPPLPFDLTVVSNTTEDSQAVAAWQRAAQQRAVRRQPLALAWPAGMFALSHVALPFAPDDPLYGATPPASANSLYLGRVALFGERGLLLVPEASLMRARYNPFFPYVLSRVDAFVAPMTASVSVSMTASITASITAPVSAQTVLTAAQSEPAAAAGI